MNNQITQTTSNLPSSPIIVDFKIDAGVNFRHWYELDSQSHWAVLTPWSPKLIHHGTGNETSLTAFGSWYTINKGLFKGQETVCKPDYIKKRLSAANTNDQSAMLKKLVDASQNGTLHTGKILKRIKYRKEVSVLDVEIHPFGRFIIIDNLCPKIPWEIRKKISEYDEIGTGSFIWGPASMKQQLLQML